MVLTVKESEEFVGSHHCGPIPVGLPDDGFGNAVYRDSYIFDTYVGLSVLQKIDFFLRDGAM